MSPVFKIKTNFGYFYTTSRGRYGRFGIYQDGERYCHDHAIEIKTTLETSCGNVEIDPVGYDSTCHKCEREKENAR